MSNAVDSPVWPWLSRNRNRRLVSSGVPNPENIRIVQSFPRYMVACGPRVNGYCPGSPSFSSYRQPGPRSAGPYTGFTGMPESVSCFLPSSDIDPEQSIRVRAARVYCAPEAH